MGFHHRKLLHPYLDSGDATMACGTYCSPIPSPLHSPVSLPLAFPWLPHLRNGDTDQIDKSYVLQIIMIVAACTVGLVMFLFTISSILKNYYSRRYYLSRRNSPILFDVNGDSPFSDDEGPAIDHPTWFIPSMGLQKSIIDSITVCKYRKDEGLIDGTECSVCLGEFQEDESLRLLPKCSHAFHVPCIDTWLRSHQNCPLCRALIVRDAGGGAELVSSTEPDSNFFWPERRHPDGELGWRGRKPHAGESESSGLRVGDDDSGRFSSEDGRDNEIPDKIFHDSDKMNCHSPIPIGSAVIAQEFEEELQPMRSDSVDSSSASMIFSVVVDLNSDLESSDTHLDDKKVSSSKDIAIGEQQGSGSSTIYKLASIGHALQKRHFSMKRSSSHNRKFKFSRRCGSQSSTLPCELEE